MGRKYRVAAITSHPVQYQAPFFQRLAQHPEIDLTVYYESDGSISGSVDAGFGIPIAWDRPLLDGYKSRILRLSESTERRWGHSRLLHDLRQEIRPSLFDAVFIHSYASLFSLFGYLTSWIAGLPILLRTESELIRERRPITSLIKAMALRSLFGRTSAFLVIGRENRAFYEHYGVKSESMFYTPYGVDNEFFERSRDLLLPERSEVRKQLGFDASTPVIVFSGKLIPRKRPMDLLRAYAELVKAMPRIGLMFVGEGELRGEIEGFIATYRLSLAKVIGFKNQTELPRFYICGDLFVLPAAFETWGLVVNEAMLFGMPVIVTDKVGCAIDLVEPDVTGEVFPAGDIHALSRTLGELIGDPARMKRMGQAAVARVRQYDYDTCIDGVLAALRHVLREDATG